MDASAEARGLDFSTRLVREIEEGLAEVRPDNWRRVRTSEEATLVARELVAAWHIRVPKDWHRHPAIDHVLIGIDTHFPFSDPIVIAPQSTDPGAPHWPHIDPKGSFCLTRLSYSAAPQVRILTTLQNVLTVLSMSEEERALEHRREFLAYWFQLGKSTSAPYRCVLDDVRASRDIVYSGDAQRGVVFAETAEQLDAWLSRTDPPKTSTIDTTRLIWLERPLIPEEFPSAGRDVIGLDEAGTLHPHVRAGSALPVVLGCEIDGHPVYACVEIEGISAKAAKLGFRPSKPRPQALIAASFNAKPAVRRSVQRADYRAVHGRTASADVDVLRQKKVAIIGCGALGGYLARAVVQAGVGSLLLVDMDTLSSGNTGRHLLGMSSVGQAKSTALRQKLLADFPSAVAIEAWIGAIESANAEQGDVLADYDLVIAAGINVTGELALNQWRLGLSHLPAMVWTWIEERAVAGHAVAIVDRADIAHSLDANAEFGMRLTSNWSTDQGHALEAGCGVAYQPYSAADMMGSINVAHRLTLDVLLGKVRQNVVRSWLGDRSVAITSGCDIDPAFDRAFSEISRNWAW